MEKSSKISSYKKVVLSQRPLFNYPNGALMFTIATIKNIIDSYEDEMDDETLISFKEDIGIVLEEMSLRN